MSQKFESSFCLKNRHIQTLYQTFFRKVRNIEFHIEEFILDDGDFLELYWHKTPNCKANTPIVIIFHGLAGSHTSPYIKGIMKSLAQAGYNTVLMHFRGCTGKPNKLPRSYHSGETGDARQLINSLSSKFPKTELFAVGFSLGGNMLLKLLGETENTTLSAAVSVSPPMQLDVCANAINQGFSRIYQRRLVKDLNKALIKKYDINDMESYIGIEKKDVNNLKTFWEFDEAYTAPIHGFKSAQDYYTKCSSKQFLKNIQIPTLIIHSSDDPFMSTEMIPKKNELSDSVKLELSSCGGHVGFVKGSLFSPIYWIEKRALKFFNSINN